MVPRGHTSMHSDVVEVFFYGQSPNGLPVSFTSVLRLYSARTALSTPSMSRSKELSEITVKVHRGQVMRKMNARSVPDLVRKAESLGIQPRLPHDGHH
jgi:DNA-binding CsgD family transcriptional regulator